MKTNDLRAPGRTAAPHPVGSPESVTLLRRYYTELVIRYYGRPTDDAEVDAVLAEEPSGDLVPPTGEFLVAWRDGAPVGCAGLRVLTPAMVELTRMYVGPEARGQGFAGLLIGTVERIAVEDVRRRGDPPRHAGGPGRGPRPVRQARLRRDRRLQQQPVRRPLVREEAALRTRRAPVGRRPVSRRGAAPSRASPTGGYGVTAPGERPGAHGGSLPPSCHRRRLRCKADAGRCGRARRGRRA